MCPKLSALCPHCSAEFPRSDIASHQSICDEAIVVCEAISVGCPWGGRRRESAEHAASCAFTYLRPLLHEHAVRIGALELENKSLRKKIEIIMPSRREEERERSETNSGLLDDQTIQILTEQERVRSDLERMFAAMADMDIKQSMLTMHMSDNMRTREEVAMIGAAVNNLRSQLHGLQLLTLRRQPGTGSPSAGGTSSAPARPAAMAQARGRQLSGRLPLLLKLRILTAGTLDSASSGNDRVKL